MSVKIWKITFDYNHHTHDLVAENIDEAITKARKIYKKDIKKEPEYYWISSIKLIAESDPEES